MECALNKNDKWITISKYIKIIISYFISSNIKHLSTFRIMQDYNSIFITCKRWNVLFQPSLPLCINCIDMKVISNLICLYSIVNNIYNTASRKCWCLLSTDEPIIIQIKLRQTSFISLGWKPKKCYKFINWRWYLRCVVPLM